MSGTNQGGGRGPQPDDDKRPARQKDESTAHPPQRSGDHPKQRWDTSRGSEPATADSARRR